MITSYGIQFDSPLKIASIAGDIIGTTGGWRPTTRSSRNRP
jgi:hypothetical protein